MLDFPSTWEESALRPRVCMRMRREGRGRSRPPAHAAPRASPPRAPVPSARLRECQCVVYSYRLPQVVDREHERSPPPGAADRRTPLTGHTWGELQSDLKTLHPRTRLCRAFSPSESSNIWPKVFVNKNSARISFKHRCKSDACILDCETFDRCPGLQTPIIHRGNNMDLYLWAHT